MWPYQLFRRWTRPCPLISLAAKGRPPAEWGTMAQVAIGNVSKVFGSVQVLHGISADIADGQFLVLVGPSGCGKATQPRIVATRSKR